MKLFSVPRRGPGAGSLKWTKGGAIGPSFFQELEEMIKMFQVGSRQWAASENLLVRSLAMVTVSNAIKKSYGPSFDSRNPNRGAWTVPVRRITGDYLKGWKVKKRGPSHWFVYNDSREAYFIEYGIHPSPFRIKRPVLKDSVKETIQLIKQTDTFMRFADNILQPGRGVGGKFTSFNTKFEGGAMSQNLHRMPGTAFRTFGL